MTGLPDRQLSIIFPVAGRGADADFRGFETAGEETLIRRSLRSFRPHFDRIGKIYYIVLEEHAQRFDIARRLAAELPDVPFELIRLASATNGPAETVARGVAKQAIAGPAIICDIDHRIDPTPLFEKMNEADCAISLWPLAGEDLKRWSVACVGKDGKIAEVAERKLPAAAGSFFGVIGCHYFRDIQKVMDACLEQGIRHFSEYFNGLARQGHPADSARIETAEFFGDKERIRLLEAGQSKSPGTIFCDIDGTLIVHEDKPDYSRLPQLLPGSREKLRNWIAEGYCVVLCTARRKEDEPRLVEMLRELDLPYHQIVTGLSSGTRVLINDRKPYEMFASQAASLEIMRNQGISGLEILPGRRSAVLRRFEGGSFAETLLVEESGKTFVRKRATKECNLSVGYQRLRDQFRTLERFAQMDASLVPSLYSEENNSHEYFYDMEFLRDYAPLADCPAAMRAAALDRLFDRFDRHLYCHRSSAAATEDWFLRHLSVKIAPKIEALSAYERLKPLLKGEGVEIDGVHYSSLEGTLARIRSSHVLPKILPRFLSLVHGDLTFQNVMTRDDGDTKVIDMEAQDNLEAIELDLGKIYQSTHSQYETWSQSDAPLCDSKTPSSIRFNYRPESPDNDLVDAVRNRWSKILDCSRDTVDAKAGFYLGLHLVRMVPFRMKTSMDHGLYALSTGLVWLNRSLDICVA
jgi:hypothetical protein